MIKRDLKLRLKLLGISLKAFLEDLDYNCNHLKRYKITDEVPLIFQYALLYLEQKRNSEKTQEILNEHKKIISLLVEKKNSKENPKIGDMCIFWNKNSDILLVATLEKIDTLFYPKTKVKRGYHFCERFVGTLPKKFHVKFFTTSSKVFKKGDIDAFKI